MTILTRLISLLLTLLILAVLLVAYVCVSLLPPSFGRRTGWVLLGERRLGAEPDLAAIPLLRTGRPRALQLRVLRAEAGLRALTLHFADGRTERVALGQTLPPGAPSRIIDLPPRWPALRRLDLCYEPSPDAATGAGGGPLVRIYGLH